MSPEQCQGQEDVDPRSDLYSMGCVLFECLTGRPPFVSRGDDKLIRMHMEQEPPDVLEFRTRLPPGLVEAIRRSLRKLPEERWQSAAEMKECVVRSD